jgi:5-methyltetrahydrofolate--homocysteine methyltransferase
MKYEAKEIFLPHLLRSAEAVKESFEVIKKAYLSGASEVKDRGKIILATVEGDVHDIGKNIVKILLENYGFSVIDLGKDVKPEKVIENIKSNDVKVVGLSALMTTTVPSMEKTIKEIRDNYSDITVIVGGAVLNKSYAMEIGADYYASDARETVKISQNILQDFNEKL